MFLPYHNLWDSIQGLPIIIKKRWWLSWICPHVKTLPYVRIDHRGGAGWMSDTYEGQVCTCCRTVTKEVKTY